MQFKVMVEQGDSKQVTTMTAVEISERFDFNITIGDLNKKQAPVYIYKKNNLKVKVYGYEG
jgi:hypothetical protein